MAFTKEDLNLWAIRLARKHLSEEATGKAIKVNSIGTNIVIHFERPEIVFTVGTKLLADFVNTSASPKPAI